MRICDIGVNNGLMVSRSGALEYYTMSNNTEGLKKCYMALEDNDSLAKLITAPTKPKVPTNI